VEPATAIRWSRATSISNCQQLQPLADARFCARYIATRESTALERDLVGHTLPVTAYAGDSGLRNNRRAL
jgi:hypothetical protein